MTDLRKAAEELIKEWDWECGEHQNKALTELIEALRQALAQPEEKMRIEGSGKLTTKPYPDGYESERDFRKALAQPEQEPVMWSIFDGKSHDVFDTKYDADNMTRFKNGKVVVKPLYTAPPKREWVGLTDEEAREIRLKVGSAADVYAKAIEVALKEKNNG